MSTPHDRRDQRKRRRPWTPPSETAAPRPPAPDSQTEVVYNFAEMDDIELVTRQLDLMKKIKRARKKQASAVAKVDKSLQSKRDKIAGKQAEISRLQGEIASLQDQADTLERNANDPDILAQLAELSSRA